ncbi:MAG: alpha/beta fold hydrolase [Candidatus Latescibacterota bacterium]|jgi:pimeloyl-ACP methyl ester carboxylesterase
MEIVVEERHQPDLPGGILHLRYRSQVDGLEDWALLLPGLPGAPWAVALHGHGSTGDQLFTRPDIREQWLAHYRHRGLGILSPHLRGNAWMCPAAAADLHDLIGWLRQAHGAQRLLFLSGSMGGTANLIYAALHPGEVSAVAALCPATDVGAYWRWCQAHAVGVVAEIAAAIGQAYGGSPDQVPESYAAHGVLARVEVLTMPLLLAHGTADALIPVAQSRALADRLHGRPGFVYRELEGGDHDAPLHQAGLLAWLDQQL